MSRGADTGVLSLLLPGDIPPTHAPYRPPFLTQELPGLQSVSNEQAIALPHIDANRIAVNAIIFFMMISSYCDIFVIRVSFFKSRITFRSIIPVLFAVTTAAMVSFDFFTSSTPPTPSICALHRQYRHCSFQSRKTRRRFCTTHCWCQGRL